MNRASFCKLLTSQTNALNNDASELSDLLRVLRQTNLVSSFSHTLRTKNTQLVSELPPSFIAHLDAADSFARAQQRQVSQAAKLIQQQANHAGIDILFLKGAAYSLSNSPNAAGRLFSDIDILVKHADLEALESFLTSNGWGVKELEDYDNKYYREWSHELPPFTHYATGVSLDIHHTLLPPISGYVVDIEDLWSCSVLSDESFRVPSQDYMILHSSIHLLLNDDVEKGFRDTLDIYWLLQAYLQDFELSDLKRTFSRSGFEREYELLLALLNKLYSPSFLSSIHVSASQYWVSAFYYAIMPQCKELDEAKHSTYRFIVYLNGHLKKMPLPIFIKHIVFKSSRTALRKLFGEFFFR